MSGDIYNSQVMFSNFSKSTVWFDFGFMFIATSILISFVKIAIRKTITIRIKIVECGLNFLIKNLTNKTFSTIIYIVKFFIFSINKMQLWNNIEEKNVSYEKIEKETIFDLEKLAKEILKNSKYKQNTKEHKN